MNSYFRFKWVHLGERVAYERASRKHRLRVEISKAKDETNEFSLNVHRGEKLAANVDDNFKQSTSVPVRLPYPQKKTEEEYRREQKAKNENEEVVDVLKTLFA